MPDTRRLQQFGEFCLLKKGVGGPDVHMKTAGYAISQDPYERSWRLAVYNNFCSSPAGAVVYSRWPCNAVFLSPETLESWIQTNWAGIPIRQNRRPARSVKKLTQSLWSLSSWMKLQYPILSEMTYDEAWKSLDAVYTWGRYVKIKYLETCRRYSPGHEHLIAPDIRAAGGWSPRRALGILYPEYADIITSKERNDRRTLTHVYAVADEVRTYVTDNWVDVSNYELEALLCNYRQSLSTGKTFYVGRTIDSELEYDTKIRTYWGDDPYVGVFDFFETRQAVFPEHCLGETQGWDGVRKDLSNVLEDHGYIWSDTIYDYEASKEDLANPVRWT